MENLIEELNKKIILFEQENEYLQLQIDSLIQSFDAFNNQTLSFSLQKEKQKIVREIYDFKRKILINKMSIYRCHERIGYIKRKGNDFPAGYGEVKFTNDNYHEINVSDISGQTKISLGNRFLNGIFNKNFFSMQKNIDKKNIDNLNNTIIFRNYTMAVKEIFDSLMREVYNFIMSLSNNQTSITDEQFIYGILKYLHGINIDYQKYSLPSEYLKDLDTIKESYINLLTSELSVYTKKNMTSNDIYDLLNVQFYGSKVRLVNHLNIFLNQFIEYQIEHFKLETDVIRYGLSMDVSDNNPLVCLSYINELNYSYENDITEVLAVDDGYKKEK